MPCVLAVDGGNTKTIAIVAALNGTILGAGRSGCGDLYNAPTGTTWPDSASAALANIEDAIKRALQAAQLDAADIVAAVFNMAGLDWPEDFVLLQTAMQERGYGRTILIQNDALGVLHAGSSDNTGVSVVCGTGGATGARGPDGRTWHSSCWQNQVQGSTQLAQKALDAVYRSQLGIDPPTSLTPRVLEFFHLPTVEDVLHLLTGRLKHPPINLGYLAPALLDEAQAGDAAARQIVIEHGTALGNYALVAARFVGLEGTAFRLVLAGGVLRHSSPLLADAIIAQVRTTSPDVQPVRYRYEPIIGVLFTALEAAEVAINDALLENLIPTIPAPSLFATVLYPPQ